MSVYYDVRINYGAYDYKPESYKVCELYIGTRMRIILQLNYGITKTCVYLVLVYELCV